MRAILQRVTNATVTIAGEVAAQIGPGMLVLLGIAADDAKEDAAWLAGKIVAMRIFPDEAGLMNLDLAAVNGDVLVVSQFTLMADYKKGNRPSFIRAARPDIAIPLYEYFLQQIQKISGKLPQTGVFGADMKVALVNDGPVSIMMDSRIEGLALHCLIDEAPDSLPAYLADMHTADDERYMRLALQEAQYANDAAEVPVGAIVVWGGKIIGRGSNQVERLNDSTAHAEMIALTSAFNSMGAKYLPEASIYVTLEPCLMCCGGIYWSRIGRIVYGAEDLKNGYRKYTGSNYPFHPKAALVTGVLGEECAVLMKDFFAAKR